MTAQLQSTENKQVDHLNSESPPTSPTLPPASDDIKSTSVSLLNQQSS